MGIDESGDHLSCLTVHCTVQYANTITCYHRSHFYCPPTKLREGNVFTGVSVHEEWVCLVPGSFQGVRMPVSMSLLVSGYARSQILSRGWVSLAPGPFWGVYHRRGWVYQRGRVGIPEGVYQVYPPPGADIWCWPPKQVVCILLECFLVERNVDGQVDLHVNRTL